MEGICSSSERGRQRVLVICVCDNLATGYDVDHFCRERLDATGTS